jgi:hypothetical protein
MNFMLKIIFLTLFFFQPNPAVAEQFIPKSWHLNSEDETHLLRSISESDEKAQVEDLEKHLDQIFSAQTSALEKSAVAPLEFPSVKANEQVPWRLVSMITDLGISKKGLIGVLTWKGNAGVSFYWQKKEKNINAANEETSGESLSTVTVSDASSIEELEDQIETSVQGILASHKIESEQELRKNFRKAVLEFAAISSQIEAVRPKNSWTVSKVRMDLSIDGSGKVSFAPSFGLNLRIRLEWSVAPSKNRVVTFLADEKPSKIKGVQQLITALGEDVEDVVSDQPKSKKFVPKTIRLAVGISASKNIGLVKGAAKSVFHIYFTKSNEIKPMANLVKADESALLLIESSPMQNQISYVRDGENVVDLKSSGSKDTVYRLNRRKFRRGLKKSMEMSGIFSDRASKHEKKNWGLKKVKTNLEVSISGAVGLATLTGSATAEVTFENTKF